mmetsp:Transcript_36513/g.122278  ORF Transcript_36513/g.122278 Transcript_36513/m.122278 type:complete len:570 (-) Transcript_36513:143-1852(-)
MPDRQEPTAGSKSQLKKQAKMLHKQQAKAEHAARGHSAMLHEARRLRERLNSDAANAVPDAALYPQLPRASACELFEAVGDALLQRTALLQRPNGEEDGAKEDGAEEDATSAQARSCRVIEKFLWRARKYNDKYASQELSLLYQLYRLGAHDGCDLVVDIGGGNANLSCLIALVFDVPVICVEMDSPRPELRGEFWLPPHLKAARAVRRVEALIQDYSLPEGYSNVLVLGKHLCGPGTDAGIDFVRRHLSVVRGCVFATCCCCKLVGAPGAGSGGSHLFADLYFGPAAAAAQAGEVCEPCGPCGPAEVGPAAAAPADSPAAAPAGSGGERLVDREAARASEEALGRKQSARAKEAARLAAAKDEARAAGKQLCRRFLRYGSCEDGGACRFHHCAAAPQGVEEEGFGSLFSKYRFPAAEAEAEAEAPAAFLRRVLPAVARATSWRNAVFNPKHRGSTAYSDLLEQAEWFESWIQGFRRRRLRELFGEEEELLYCGDDVHSQQNRCLVSGRTLRGGGADGGHEAFLRLLEAQFVKHGASLPMDLRVRGIVSAKFGYDGSALPWDPSVELEQ